MVSFFWGRGGGERTCLGVKKVSFIGDILKGCSLSRSLIDETISLIKWNLALLSCYFSDDVANTTNKNYNCIVAKRIQTSFAIICSSKNEKN